jgi:hypothetical protein
LVDDELDVLVLFERDREDLHLARSELALDGSSELKCLVLGVGDGGQQAAAKGERDKQCS